MTDDPKEGLPRERPEAPADSEAEHVAGRFAAAEAEDQARRRSLVGSAPGDVHDMDRDPETGAPMWLVQALDESDADIAAGRFVTSEVVHEEFRRSEASRVRKPLMKRFTLKAEAGTLVS